MKDNTQSSTEHAPEVRDPRLTAFTAELNTRIEAGRISVNEYQACLDQVTAQLDKPVLVSCHVSTYMESSKDRGSYAVQLFLEDGTITTCATLMRCSSDSLRIMACRAAEQIIGDQLALAQANRGHNTTRYLAPSSRTKSKSTSDQHPTAERDSFWVTMVRTDGMLELGRPTNKESYKLANSAEFAELAFHQFD